MINKEALISQGCVMHFTGNAVSSNSPKTITANGYCRQILPFPGAGIAMFDGDGDYLIVPDSDEWNFGTGDFTIEFLLYAS